jgi:hypothetical protein
MRTILCAGLLPLFAVLSYAADVNRTIDDTLGDSATGAKPIYIPADSWGTGVIKPSPNEAFDQTSQGCTYHPGQTPCSVSMSFSGEQGSGACCHLIFTCAVQGLRSTFTLSWLTTKAKG